MLVNVNEQFHSIIPNTDFLVKWLAQPELYHSVTENSDYAVISRVCEGPIRTEEKKATCDSTGVAACPKARRWQLVKNQNQGIRLLESHKKKFFKCTYVLFT